MDTTDYYSPTVTDYDYSAYSSTATPVDPTVMTVYWLFMLAAVVIGIVANWRIFQKAGKPGWAAIVPFYNLYTLLKIVGRPGWWLILLFIPIVQIVMFIILSLDLAKVFGKSNVFGIVGLFLFAPIGYLMLAFGDAKYTPPAPRQ